MSATRSGRDGTERRGDDELELEADVHGLDATEQGRLVTCLSASLGPGTASAACPGQRCRQVDTEWFGGES